MTQPLTIALVAGEPSGDQLGADLIRALRQRWPEARFVGIGGAAMIEAGLESWFPLEALSVMGFGEVLRHLPRLLRLRRQLIDRLLLYRPALFIGIDAPDFNFRVERILKQQGIPAFHYVGPSVWAWRQSRLKKLPEINDGVFLLFPFEEALYADHGVRARFVGHPMAWRIPLTPDRTAARQQLGLAQSACVTALLPGSRMSEVQRIFDAYLEAARLLRHVHRSMQFIVPAATPAIHQYCSARAQQYQARWGQLALEIVAGESGTVLAAADQAIVFSGTATLEAALYGCPMIITGRVHPLTAWIARRLLVSKWVGLPNVLAGREIVPELLQEAARGEKLAVALGRLVLDEKARQRQKAAFRTLHETLRQPAGERIADTLVEWGALPAPTMGAESRDADVPV